MATDNASDASRVVAEAVARQSYSKLVAYLAASTRNLPEAEDALSEAFAAALSKWPEQGVPQNPEAWLLTVARRKIIDTSRRAATVAHGEPHVKVLQETLAATETLGHIPDHRLALMFACAHPAIDVGVRAPLILQVVLGLDAKTIASAFLVAPAAMSKRLVRAKAKIREAGIPLTLPENLAERLGDVLDAIYIAFGEAWADPEGSDVVLRDLTDESLFLARLVAQLLPQEPEALGLCALLLFLHSRRAARRDSAGNYVPLAKQDMQKWNRDLIAEAEACLSRASQWGKIGRFQIEAALQSAHIFRLRTNENNWQAVLSLYDALRSLVETPVVLINRAVACAHVHGPEAGLRALQEVAGDSQLTDYQPYWAAQADLLAQVGAYEEARRACLVAIGLEKDESVRRFLRERMAQWGDGSTT